MRRSALFAALFAAVTASGWVRAESPCLRGPSRGWRDGPVRYLLTDDEWHRFGRLESAAAQAAFVARFWKRIDAEKSEADGSFRERVESRCLEAEKRFGGDTPPGWRSDRGRVMILLGEPASVEMLPGDAESVAREVWVYPYPAGGGRSSLRIPFYRGLDGRTRLEAPRAATSVGTPVRFDALRGRIRTTSRYLGPLRGTSVGAIIDAILARPTVEFPAVPPRVLAPPSRDEIDEGTTAASSLADGAWFFRAEDGSVLALLAVAVAPDSGLEEDSTRGSAFLVDGPPAGGSDAKASVPLASVRASARGRRLHVGRLLLEPGTQTRIRYAFTDAKRETMLVRTRGIAVPELGAGGFSASSIVPAESFGPLPEGQASVFAVGSEVVVPRPEAAFARGETLRLYLQVYGAESDRAAGRPRIDVEFRFLRETDRRPFRHQRPLRLRGASGASLGLSLPIGDWPVGSYRVEVNLRDRVTRRSARSEGSFRVTE